MARDPFGSITPGELRHRVTFQRNVPDRDQFGAENPHWFDVITAWARLESLGGAELANSQQVYPESNTKITVRGVVAAKLDVTMRAIFRERQFDLVNFSDVDERLIVTHITAIERPPGRNI